MPRHYRFLVTARSEDSVGLPRILTHLWPFVMVAFLLFLVATPGLAASVIEDPLATSGPADRTSKPSEFPALKADANDLDTVWYDFSTGTQGWSFLNPANVVQIYYPDVDCQEVYRVDTTVYSSGLSAAMFGGQSTLQYYANFNGYYEHSCDYEWWIKSCVSPNSGDWNGVFRIEARIYITDTTLQYVMIGAKTAGSSMFTYYGWGAPLSSGQWHTIVLNEPSPGAFDNLEAVSILAGAYDTQESVYVDYVRGIKDAATAPTLVSPLSGTVTENNLPTFVWTGNGVFYSLQIATDPLFRNIIVDTTSLVGGSCTITTPLPFSDYTFNPGGGSHDPNYYWRVRAHYSAGEPGPWSDVWTLITTGPHEVPTEFPTIQAARAAFPLYIGGTVLVRPGTYTGPDNCDISMGGEKPVDIIASSSNPSQTIIDCEYKYPGFYYDWYTVGNPKIKGFTIRNAADGGDVPAAAVTIWSATGTVEDCIIENSGGNGIYVTGEGHGTITNTIIRGSAYLGIRASGGSVTVNGATIENNRGGGVVLEDGGSNIFTDCIFQGNAGTALDVEYAAAKVTGCTFYNNTSGNTAGGILVVSWDEVLVDSCLFDYNSGKETGAISIREGNNITISRSTFAYNSGGIHIVGGYEYARVTIDQCIFAHSTSGPGIEWYDEYYDISVSCTDSYGNAGGNWMGRAVSALGGHSGNIELDPLFCAPGARDYSLSMASPCLAENNSCGLMGRYDLGCTPSLACAAFTETEREGPAPLWVSFQSNVSGGVPPLSYEWDFGDGDTAYVANPSHLFEEEGEYTVRFTVSDRIDQTCTRTIDITVTAGLSCSLAVSTTAGPAPLEVTFTGIAMGGQPPYYYEWTFSDLYDWFGSEDSTYTKVFDTAGVYTANLTIWDAREQQCQTSVEITVSPEFFCEVVAEPDSGAAPLAVAFAAEVSGGTEPYSYLWTFGDDSTSTEANPAHVYAAGGEYTATLTVTDATDAECLSMVEIMVGPELNCLVWAAPDSGTAPLEIAFAAEASGGEPPYRFYWDFGDGSVDSSQTISPIHTYEGRGLYTATLHVVDARDTACASVIEIAVEDPPMLSVSPQSLDFGTEFDTLVVLIQNAGDGTLLWRVTDAPHWLTASPASGSVTDNAQTVLVIADRGSLEPGPQTGWLTIASETDTVWVAVDIEPRHTVITITPSLLDYGNADASLKFNLCNISGASVSWEAIDLPAWVAVSPSSGTLSAGQCRDVTVDVDRSSLHTGAYPDRLRVRANGEHVLNVRLAMSVPLWNLTTGRQGVQVYDPLCVMFNGVLNEETLPSGLVISGATQELYWEHSFDMLDGDSVSVICLYPADESPFPPLQEIVVGGSGTLADVNGTPYLTPPGPQLVFVTGAVVWPGDGNADGVVDERDILPIGLFFGASGPARQSTGMEWGPHYGLAHGTTSHWQPYRAVYADADGSGVVDADDVCAITDNWGAQSVGAPQRGNEPLVTAESVFGGFSHTVLEALHEAVCNCPESPGREDLRAMLAAQIEHAAGELPRSPQLHQNYPNPFNPTTTIGFYLPQSAPVSLRVYNLLGQDVATLYEGYCPQGSQSVEWDATDRSGKSVSSGMYFYVLEVDGGVRLSARMMLLK